MSQSLINAPSFGALNKKASPAAKFCVVGVDEAGCGALAGPVVAAAVSLGSVIIDGLTDSKRMSPLKREQVCAVIMDNASCYAIAVASHREIDRINILRARLLAMKRAISALSLHHEVNIVVDGTHLPDVNLPMQSVVGGDLSVADISAASVLAKVYRDHLMRQYHLLFPEYGFAAHKGYPTATHISALDRYGLSPQHRRSFKPCLDVGEKANEEKQIKPTHLPTAKRQNLR